MSAASADEPLEPVDSEAVAVYRRLRGIMGDPSLRSTDARRRAARASGGTAPFDDGRDPAGLGDVLDAVTLLELTTQIYEEAARVDPPLLRTLDALHLAVALDLGDDLETIVTYDDRFADAASANGVRVTAPS